MAYVSPPYIVARKRRVRSRILDSAAQLFAQKGYESCSIKDIVALASSSVGNCYFYFNNKEALLREATRRLCRRTDIKINRAAKDFYDAPSRMAASLWIGSFLMVSYPALARMLFIEATKTVNSRNEVLRFLQRRVELSFSYRNTIRRQSPRNTAAGLLRDPAFIKVVWTGAVWGAFEAVAKGELALSAEELGRKLVFWNLGALSMPAAEIELIIEKLKTGINTELDFAPDAEERFLTL